MPLARSQRPRAQFLRACSHAPRLLSRVSLLTVLVLALSAPVSARGALVINTVAGGNGIGYSGDGGPAVGAQLAGPADVAATPDGGYLIADESNYVVRKVSPGGTISTVAGTGEHTPSSGSNGDGGPALDATFSGIEAVAPTAAGGFLIGDRVTGEVRKVDAMGEIDTVASGFESITDLSPTGDGGFLVADAGEQLPPGPAHIYKVSSGGSVSVVAGGGSSFGDGGPATSAQLSDPSGVAATADGFLIADRGANRVRRVSNGTIDTVAGTGAFGFSGDGGPATSAQLDTPLGVATTPDGGYVIADSGRSGGGATRLRKVSATGVISTIAGTGEEGTTCDGAQALAARIRARGVSVKSDGDLLSSDFFDRSVRLVGEGPVTRHPTAKLSIAPNPALTYRTVVFDASSSADPCTGLSGFTWDLDGDGSYETSTGSSPRASRFYPSRSVFGAGVLVRNNAGLTAAARDTLDVRLAPPDGPLGASIDNGARYTDDPDVMISLTWPRLATDALLSNDGGFQTSSQVPVAAEVPWRLHSSGFDRLPETVYVRFVGGESGPETYQDDIILDEARPKVLSATLVRAARASGFESRRSKRRYRLRIRAKDNLSGVSRIQITQKRRRPGRWRRYHRRLTFAARPGRKVYVRVRDRAGNRSKWRRVRRRR